MGNKIKLGDIQISIKMFGIVFTSLCSAVAAVFLAMNFYFAPRHFVTDEISPVKQDVAIVKKDVKAIKKYFDDAVAKAVEDVR